MQIRLQCPLADTHVKYYRTCYVEVGFNRLQLQTETTEKAEKSPQNDLVSGAVELDRVVERTKGEELVRTDRQGPVKAPPNWVTSLTCGAAAACRSGDLLGSCVQLEAVSTVAPVSFS